MYNKVIYEGRLTKAPETIGNSNGTAWVRFSLAQSYKTKDGKEESMFLDVSASGKTGDYCIKYLQAGDLVLVDGRLSVRAYSGNDGVKRMGVKVYADKIECLAHARPKEQMQEAQPTATAPSIETAQFVPYAQPTERTIPSVRSQGIEALSEDDLPF